MEQQEQVVMDLQSIGRVKDYENTMFLKRPDTQALTTYKNMSMTQLTNYLTHTTDNLEHVLSVYHLSE